VGNAAKDAPSEDFSTVDGTGTAAHEVSNPDSYTTIHDLFLCALRVSSLLMSLTSETAFNTSKLPQSCFSEMTSKTNANARNT